MRLVWLSWYVSGMLALLSVLTSLISYAPGPNRVETLLPIVFATGAFVGIGASVCLGRLRREHWIHQSKPLWAGFVAVALAVTVLVVLIG